MTKQVKNGKNDQNGQKWMIMSKMVKGIEMLK